MKIIGIGIFSLALVLGFWSYSQATGNEITVCAKKSGLVYVIGDGSVSVLAMAAILTIYTVDVYAVIPAGKYPFIRGITSAAVVLVHGIEE